MGFGHPQIGQNQATGLDFMEEPRSAWMVSCPGKMPGWSQVRLIRRWARAAVSP